MINVYVAGPLFNEAAIGQRLKEGKALRFAFDILGIAEYEIMNPIESPVNFKVMKPTAAEIYDIDYTFIKKTTHFFFDISTNDVGTYVELGQALQLLENDKTIKVYPVHSDIRLGAAGEYDGRHVPVGSNQYMIGALDYYDIKIYDTFDDALEQFKIDVH